MEWYTKPFKVKDKVIKENGFYTNCYLYYDEEYVDKDGNKKTGTKRYQIPKEHFDSIVKGNTVQLVRVDFVGKDETGKYKKYDFIKEVNVKK